MYIHILVPIRVGMILFGLDIWYQFDTCPHTRGDDPQRAESNR